MGGRERRRGKDIVSINQPLFPQFFLASCVTQVSRKNSENRDFKMKIYQWHTFARANSVCFSLSIFVDWTKMEKCSRLRKFFTGYGVNVGKLILVALRILTNDKCSKTF